MCFLASVPTVAVFLLSLLLAGLFPQAVWCIDFPALPPAPVPYLLGGQSTAIWQYHPSFSSPYEGPNSLHAHAADALSHSYALYTGARVLPWLELYANPEMIRGNGISDGLGLAGYTNGEVIRNPAAGQDPYLARAFARVTIPLGQSLEPVETSLLQIAGERPVHRLVFSLGMMAATDIFDTNSYANSTRTQFMNWALINNLAYDFAADTRGYSRGFALEWSNGPFAVRGGMLQMPTAANGINLDDEVIHSHGDQVEIEARLPLLPERLTVVRLLGFHNQGSMGNYRTALALAQRTGGPPDITHTRKRGAEKWGFGVNLEHALSSDGATGAFARFGWSDGASESFAFTEAERTATAGAQVSGQWWNRSNDRWGLGLGMNEVGNAHAAYLAAGGVGFMLGDGHLCRRPETFVETYYLLHLVDWFNLTLDYQFIANPGYNRDRGPVSVIALRAHLEAVASSAH